MGVWKNFISVFLMAAIAVTVAPPVAAQDQAELERAESEVEMRMREAEMQLEEAAQRSAERQLDDLFKLGRHHFFQQRDDLWMQGHCGTPLLLSAGRLIEAVDGKISAVSHQIE